MIVTCLQPFLMGSSVLQRGITVHRPLLAVYITMSAVTFYLGKVAFDTGWRAEGVPSRFLFIAFHSNLLAKKEKRKSECNFSATELL